MTCIELVTLIKDVITSLAAIIGVCIAGYGLNTWKRQLAGQSEYELSRRILLALFRYQNAINGVRYSIISPHEMPNPPEEEAKSMNHKQIMFYGKEKAYQARWDKVQAERVELEVALLEGRALWGDELQTLVAPLFKLENNISAAVLYYLRSINPNEDERDRRSADDTLRQHDGSMNNILYDTPDREPDDFRKKFQRGVDAVEKYLKPKLRH